MAEFRLEAHPDYGFLQVRPTPSPEEIDAFYAAEFYSDDYKRLNDSSIEVQTEQRDWYDAGRATICRTIEAVSGHSVAGQRVLDVGCGWGESLRYFRSEGMECFGFDPAPEAVEHARKDGLEVRVAGVEKMDVFDGATFDVITLLTVLEHLSDPVDTVRQLRDLLVPGGLLIIDVPNEFNAFQTVGQTIHELDEWWVAPPAHLNYFSASSLRAMLEGEGFEVPVVRSSFPIEMFLLFGDNYVGDSELGRASHQRRMNFEANLRDNGQTEKLDRLYEHFAELDLGRQVIAYGRRPAEER